MMANELVFHIDGDVDMRPKMYEAWQAANKGIQSGPITVTLGRPKRNTKQNALLWALLGEVSQQVDWYGQRLSAEDWKNVCTASLTKQSAVPGIDGGVVMVGASTSKMDKQTFSNLIEVVYSFGAQQGVKFSDRVSVEYGEWLESIK